MRWVDVIIDSPSDSAAAQNAFWAGVLGWQVGPPWPAHPEFLSLEASTGDSYVHAQTIGGPPRVHLDVTVTDLDAEVARLVSIGAQAAARTQDWQLMSSPGGLPFCLIPGGDHERPPPAEWPEGHRSRLLQVCIDSPASLHDNEITFWREATSWPFVGSDSAEFGGKVCPPAGLGSSVQLLFQRLGDDDPGHQTRAHLDVAAGGAVDAETRRILNLGADLIGPGSGWVALRDPAGLPFCVIAQEPGAISASRRS